MGGQSFSQLEGATERSSIVISDNKTASCRRIVDMKDKFVVGNGTKKCKRLPVAGKTIACVFEIRACPLAAVPASRSTDRVLRSCARGPHSSSCKCTGLDWTGAPSSVDFWPVVVGHLIVQIKFWNTSSGTMLKNVDTGSPVTSIHWSLKEQDLSSSLGHPRNLLIVWQFPAMTRIKEIKRANNYFGEPMFDFPSKLQQGRLFFD